ncbi:dihydroxyacetone kinase subunit L [Calidifontibacter sp. DB0510]|uniref:Dihydroxyacetone kinase subunit L n=1 Tax=Metallococcus carri TaxID=1656884 RepID=A0A967EHR5_9MICO|nr:dihydroxyacetone kinase subunit DhaL [Metallococcus carri]NHN56883.1 dihydroxyacetone kinase subunit L [Metallococcus carri]NOP37628.1 dihydroxyacetone kinase subunit L [Calidifontibacter sp. DB2511S]
MAAISTEQAGAWLADYAQVIGENAAMLTDLDRQTGDADHGSNMDRGMKAVAALDVSSFDSPGALLKKAGMTLVSNVGGASGPLYGTFFLRFAGALDDGPDDASGLLGALRAGLEGIEQRGKAERGDKTMIDALAPAVEAFETQSGAGTSAALTAAAKAAARGRDEATDLIARKGRASYLGERSKGKQDPGATSMTLLLESAARTLGSA